MALKTLTLSSVPSTTLKQLTIGLVMAALVAGVTTSQAQEQATITPNYKDADIRQIIEAVSEVTGRNFVIDPRVKAQVTMLSATPMSPEAFYETFLSILQVHGFVAVSAGNVIKILPDANARQMPTSQALSGPGDDVVTRVVAVENVGAAQLVPILRPLVPQYGHLAAHPASNMLIISDRTANVDRLVRIIGRIDQAGDEEIDVIALEHASAAEIVRVLTTLVQSQNRGEAATATTNMVADERTNSVLLGGDRALRLRLRALITHLDTPLEDGGNTQVRYLAYADAVELSEKLREHVAQITAPQAGQQAAATSPSQDGSVVIWSDEQTNALIITAPPEVMRSVMTVVDKLDIRRAQVAVEAIIVEVNADKTKELGITWAVDGSDDNNAVGVTNFPGGATGIGQIAAGLGANADPTSLAAGLPGGITMAVGRIQDSGTNFALVLNALAADGDTNIISTPSIITMDNEEAEIKVGQEVPFITGQFTNTGAAQGSVNPFQTVQRQEVGTSLKITPQINQGDAVLLSIEQETSSISSAAGAVDIITNNRSIRTNVIVEDGGILVLGGLIDDTLRENDDRIPFFGRIPVIGNLFRNRRTQKMKSNLMVFIRPKILRDGVQAAIETNSKYNYMRNWQLGTDPQDVQLMPNEKRSVLPPLEDMKKHEPAIDLRKVEPEDGGD